MFEEDASEEFKILENPELDTEKPTIYGEQRDADSPRLGYRISLDQPHEPEDQHHRVICNVEKIAFTDAEEAANGQCRVYGNIEVTTFDFYGELDEEMSESAIADIERQLKEHGEDKEKIPPKGYDDLTVTPVESQPIESVLYDEIEELYEAASRKITNLAG